jgi:hypothetical protein
MPSTATIIAVVVVIMIVALIINQKELIWNSNTYFEKCVSDTNPTRSPKFKRTLFYLFHINVLYKIQIILLIATVIS